MNPSGVLLVIAGTWIATQVIAGHALDRLGIGPGLNSSKGQPSAAATPPATKGFGVVDRSSQSTVGTGSWA